MFRLEKSSLKRLERFAGSIAWDDSVRSNELGHSTDGFDLGEASTWEGGEEGGKNISEESESS